MKTHPTKILLASAALGLGLLSALLSVQQPAAAQATAAPPAKAGALLRDCADCPEMVLIPAGSFEMGGSDGRDDEKPVHSVRVKSFAMGKTEVTQAQWQAIMGNNPSQFKDCGANCPVEQVSWNDAQEFIKRLNAKTGKQYRLPSEAEWEYACRAGGRHAYCGSDDVNSVAWYGGSYLTPPAGNSGDKIHPVGRKQANAFGLHDMSGNVWEWVQDCWNDSYSGAPGDGSAWTTGDCTKRVLRGGSWYYATPFARAARRNKFSATHRGGYYGLRLARTLP